MATAIFLKGISKVFDDVPGKKLAALENINLEIAAGEIFIFLGPSGSGKSTLLRIASGLEESYRGEVRLSAGFNPDDLSFVFQQFALLPWLTVEENIGVGLMSKLMPEEEKKKVVVRELEQFGLEKFARAYPRELSGGMKQRVGIARAFAADPKIIFMDEPFSELDSFTAQDLRQELLTLWHERKPTIVIVTHIIEEALELADRIAVLTARPGKIEKIVVNHLPRPRQRRSPDFFRLEDELYKLVRP